MKNGKTVTQLYAQCRSNERNVAKFDISKLRLLFAKQWLFSRPLFVPPPVVDEESVISKVADLKIRVQLWEAGKYREILDRLRKCTKSEVRLFLLAHWLSQEMVCEPEDILGAKVLRRMLKKKFSLSKMDFRHADRVRVWLPYFERLLEDLGGKNLAELRKFGYDETAVQAARGKRSAIAAACDWLANRGESRNVDAPTLRNAYSRIYGTRRHKP